MKTRGFFGVAMYQPKTGANYGSLVRTANILGAKYIAVIGPRFRKQASDTMKSHRHIPVFEYATFEDFHSNLPHGARLVGVELDDRAKDLASFNHPQQAIYIMGSEDNGLPPKVIQKCHHLVRLKGERSMNVSVAGSIVLYHRVGMGA